MKFSIKDFFSKYGQIRRKLCTMFNLLTCNECFCCCIFGEIKLIAVNCPLLNFTIVFQLQAKTAVDFMAYLVQGRY